MVCFECGKCNETVKKPKLAKHLLSCRSQYVSCIDCSMRFNWDDWEGHTSCISEAQKYQGNLFQEKQSQNKGKVKQDAWIEKVEELIEDPNTKISPQIKGLLKNLLGFSNIPRKQRPFGNFVKNSLRIWNDNQINEMWDVIAVAIAKPAAPPAAAAEAAKATNGNAAEKAEKPEKPAKRKWPGWKEAVDEELDEAEDGSLEWQDLRDKLVKRYRAEAEQVNGATKDELNNLALADIPESYLSKEDALVRLPAKKK